MDAKIIIQLQSSWQNSNICCITITKAFFPEVFCIAKCLLLFYNAILQLHISKMHNSPVKCWFFRIWIEKRRDSLFQYFVYATNVKFTIFFCNSSYNFLHKAFASFKLTVCDHPYAIKFLKFWNFQLTLKKKLKKRTTIRGTLPCPTGTYF